MGQYFLHFSANWKKFNTEKTSQDALSKVYLNKYGSYFKFILLLSGNISLKPGPSTPQRNDILLGLSTTVIFRADRLSDWFITWD